MKTGFYTSGTAHAGIIIWLLLGGLFLRAEDSPTLENTQVSLLTSEEFAALSPPELPAATGAQPSQPEAATPDAPEPAAPDEPIQPSAPTVVDDQPPSTIQSPDPLVVPLAPTAPTASPRPSQRVAPQPVVNETPDAAVDDIPQEAIESVDEPAQIPEPAPEVEQTTAPEETSDRIVSEAVAPPASAPASSARPPARPERPKPTPTVTPTPTTPPAPPSTQNADIMAALNEANVAPVTQSAPSGPPLSEGEKDALRISVSECWNVGTLSSEALRTIVIVGLDVGLDGKPVSSSLRMISFSGGGQAAANQAFEAARRAIIRCGAKGFDLPAEKYDHWKEIEITFDPEKMRNR
ncbi:energy transducer TonB [Falsihalocynthiibacter sp. S25ZX9]|uniref:energy transducer TonB n=1 Tax=unclassified Falsihalocynthiibacter TaxID=2854191 RepID=UPI00350ED90A